MMIEQSPTHPPVAASRVKPRPYRVLLVDLASKLGGIETRVLDQVRGLQDVVEVCKVAVREGTELHDFLKAEGLPFELLPPVSYSDPRLLPALRAIIQRGRYNIVDAHNVQSFFWGHGAALLAGVRGRVATIHSDYVNETPGNKGKLYEGVFRSYQKVTREYITITEVLQDKMVALGEAKRSSLVHNTIPVPDAAAPEKDYDLLREWGYTPDDFVVGIIARLDPRKAHKYLLEAMTMLRDLPQVKLLVVGGGALLPELEAQVAASGIGGNVRFAGFRPDPQDIPRVLQFIDCYCLPSLLEGLPYGVLEAAAYARPIVATPVGGMATLLDHGETALLVPPRDAKAIADSIRWLVEHPQEKRQMGLAAYQLVRDSYGSVDVMLEKILQVYDRSIA